jgi:predicted nucleotidyltransferase
MELKYDLKQVLSPRQFLSKEQRLIPRHDKRKEQIRTDIKNSLLVSRNYNEFERLMKEKRYQVIKQEVLHLLMKKSVCEGQ